MNLAREKMAKRSSKNNRPETDTARYAREMLEREIKREKQLLDELARDGIRVRPVEVPPSPAREARPSSPRISAKSLYILEDVYNGFGHFES